MKTIFLYILLTLSLFTNAQETYQNKKLGFSMEKPTDWIEANQTETIENLKEQIKLSPALIEKLITENKGTLDIVAYYKYPINSVDGVIPTIKIVLRKNDTKSLIAFKNAIETSYSSLKSYFPDFSFTTIPTIKEIDNKKSIYTVCNYTIKTKSKAEKVNATVYAVPIGDKFYQITFMDSEKENCQDFFEKIAKSIHIE